MVTLDTVRKLALACKEVEEHVSYDSPSFKVRGKLFARIRDDEHTVVVNISKDERAVWHKLDPATFAVPEHYKNYDYMVIDIRRVSEQDLRTLIANAWRRCAPKSIIG